MNLNTTIKRALNYTKSKTTQIKESLTEAGSIINSKISVMTNRIDTLFSWADKVVEFLDPNELQYFEQAGQDPYVRFLTDKRPNQWSRGYKTVISDKDWDLLIQGLESLMTADKGEYAIDLTTETGGLTLVTKYNSHSSNHKSIGAQVTIDGVVNTIDLWTYLGTKDQWYTPLLIDSSGTAYSLGDLIQFLSNSIGTLTILSDLFATAKSTSASYFGTFTSLVQNKYDSLSTDAKSLVEEGKEYLLQNNTDVAVIAFVKNKLLAIDSSLKTTQSLVMEGDAWNMQSFVFQSIIGTIANTVATIASALLSVINIGLGAVIFALYNVLTLMANAITNTVNGDLVSISTNFNLDCFSTPLWSKEIDYLEDNIPQLYLRLNILNNPCVKISLPWGYIFVYLAKTVIDKTTGVKTYTIGTVGYVKAVNWNLSTCKVHSDDQSSLDNLSDVIRLLTGIRYDSTLHTACFKSPENSIAMLVWDNENNEKLSDLGYDINVPRYINLYEPNCYFDGNEDNFSVPVWGQVITRTLPAYDVTARVNFLTNMKMMLGFFGGLCYPNMDSHNQHSHDYTSYDDCYSAILYSYNKISLPFTGTPTNADLSVFHVTQDDLKTYTWEYIYTNYYKPISSALNNFFDLSIVFSDPTIVEDLSAEVITDEVVSPLNATPSSGQVIPMVTMPSYGANAALKTSLITAGLMIAATAATIGVIKVKRKLTKVATYKYAKTRKTLEQFEKEPTTENYKAYKSSVKRYNLFAKLTGNSTVNLVDGLSTGSSGSTDTNSLTDLLGEVVPATNSNSIDLNTIKNLIH